MPSSPHGLPPGCGAASHSHGSVEATTRAVGEPSGELAAEDAALGRAQGKASSGWAASSRSWGCSRARALPGSLHGQTECTRSEIEHRVGASDAQQRTHFQLMQLPGAADGARACCLPLRTVLRVM